MSNRTLSLDAIYACIHSPETHDHELYFILCRLNLCVLLPIAILGLFFNASAMRYLHRPPKITSGVFVYLHALLVLDFCQLLVTSATILLPQICNANFLSNHTFYGACMIQRRFIQHTLPRVEVTVNTMHVWTIAALSAHRYWKISRPVVSRLNDTMRRAYMMLSTMFLSVLIFRSPLFVLELRLRSLPIWKIVNNKEYTEQVSAYRVIYHSMLSPLLDNVVPFIWMSVFSLLTLFEIFKSRKFNMNSLRGYEKGLSISSRQPLTPSYRKRAEGLRQKQELRATISIVMIIGVYMVFHALRLFTIGRKWQLLMQQKCPERIDYIHSHVAYILAMVSSTINAFVFIAFTGGIRKYIKKLLRKTTSRTLSSSSEPPLSPKTTTTVETANNIFAEHCVV